MVNVACPPQDHLPSCWHYLGEKAIILKHGIKWEKVVMGVAFTEYLAPTLSLPLTASLATMTRAASSTPSFCPAFLP